MSSTHHPPRLAAALAACLLAAGLAWAADWPQLGGNAQHTGYTDDSPVPFERTPQGSQDSGLHYRVAWVKTVWPEQLINAQPVIADGRLFIGTLQGNLYALDAKTGERLWVFSTDPSKLGKPIMLSPAVDQGRVFFGCLDGKLYALNARAGTLLWTVAASAPLSASPCVAEGTVYIGDHWGEFLAVNAADGKVKWRRPLSWIVDSTAAYQAGRVYVLTEDSKLHCLSAADGKTLWEFDPPCGGFFRGQYPVLHHGCVLFRPIPIMAGFNTAQPPVFQWNDFKSDHNHIRTLSDEIHAAMLPGGSGRLPEVVEQTQEALIKWYEANPSGQTYYAVDAQTGKQRAPLPHQHTLGALAGGIMAPAVCQDGTVMVNIMWVGGNVGRVDLDRNRLVDICVEYARMVGFACNGDEDHYVSVGGPRAFIKHFSVGGVTMECAWNYRDRTVALYDQPFGGYRSGGERVDVLHERDMWNPFLFTWDFSQPHWFQVNSVSVLPPRHDLSSLAWRLDADYANGGGAMPIVGNLFYHQERSSIVAWQGKESS